MLKNIRWAGLWILLAVCGVAGQSSPAAPPMATPTPATPAPTPEISSWEVGLLVEINALRTDPQKAVALLEDYKKYYKGNELRLPDGTAVLTFEGLGAVEDAINFVRQLKPLPPYQLSPAAGRAAQEHLKDLVAHDATGHKGSDGSFPPDRVRRQGLDTYYVGENIYYSGSGNAREAVLSWLIDDGSKLRLHRRNLFSDEFKFLGLAFGSTKTWKQVCVLTLVDQAGPATVAPGKSPGPRN